VSTQGAKPDEHARIRETARRARAASRVVAALDGATRSGVLMTLRSLVLDRTRDILDANARDMDAARDAGVDAPKLRRLALSEDSIARLADGIAQVAAMDDPVGAVTRESERDNGLVVRRVRSPLGVIAMIYEARPGVTLDAFALCFKAGNACILKGGREAARSNALLAGLAHRALREHGAPENAVGSISTIGRDAVRTMLTLSEDIDLVIPRGGEALIRFVHEHARVPTVLHFKGVCHIYVDEDADLDRALDIVASAKTSNPATCNTVECVLVHESVSGAFLPKLKASLDRLGVELRADPRARALAPDAALATDDDWGREYLDLILACRVVDSMDEAIEHIERFGSDHTEAIVTRDGGNAEAFTRRVGSSCVLVNASTRFNDGYQLGLGAEIGISTSRVHAYGPMGLEGLTIERWVVLGDGQTR